MLSSICGDGEYESADDTDAEQLATAHCTSAQQSGGGSAPATAKADRLAARNVCGRNATQWRKPLKSTLRGSRAICHSVQGAAIKLVQPHPACTTVAPACVRCGYIYSASYIYIYISIYLCIFIYIIYPAKSPIGCDH